MSDDTEETDELKARFERQRRMAEAARDPEFLAAVDRLMGDSDLEVFDEEWMAVTIVNRAKELVLAQRLGEIDESEARAEMAAFYERKREFFLDESVDGDEEELEDLDDLLGLDEEE